MDRRHFIGTAAALTAEVQIGGLPALAMTPSMVKLLVDRLLAVQADPVSASIVGRAFLEELPANPEVNDIIDVLLTNLELPLERIVTMAPEKLRARLRSQTMNDFEIGKTASVGGWILSDTEAWLCGLAALRSS